MLSTIIITRNTRDMLLDLLQSLQEDTALSSLIEEIIIVDNGSEDDTEKAVREEFSKAIVLRNETNRGFAAAVNQAWRSAKGDLILLLNSDTRIIPGEMVRLLDFMTANPLAGVAGPSLVYEDMRQQRSFASAPSLTQEFVPRPILELMSPARHGGKTWGSVQPEPVDSLIGAALVIKRNVLEALGGFDERFFFFFEETDFCVRARQHGWAVVLFPSARIIHYQGKTVGVNWVKGRIEYNISLNKFIRKHHGVAYQIVFTGIRALKTLLILIGSTILLPLFVFNRSRRRDCLYRLTLLRWYLHGCPDKGGLKS